MTRPPLRIGIEAQRLFRAHKHGMDIVALELIRELQRQDQHNEYFIFVKPDVDNQVLTATPNFHIVEVNGGPYPSWEQWALPRAARQAGVQLLHCTSNTAPLHLDMPLVLTLHDIIFLEALNLRHGTWYQRLGNLYRRWNVPRVVAGCRRIFTVSAYEQGQILATLPLPAAQVQVVHNGVGEQFCPIHDQAALAAVRQRLGLPERFVFFLANTDPKKNFRGVLQALALLRQQGQLPCKCVILDFEEADLLALLAEIGAPELRADIVCCGYLPHHELPFIYNLAEIFLYPSLRESFGLPLLEAMACGTPVVSSTTSAMPEVAGDAALLIDPTQPAQLAAAIAALQHDPALRAELREKGLRRAQQFSWAQMARQVKEHYEDVVATPALTTAR